MTPKRVSTGPACAWRYAEVAVPRKKKDGKWTTFFVAKSAPDGSVEMREIDPHDAALKSDPELGGLARGSSGWRTTIRFGS
jgi:hypothetical protein